MERGHHLEARKLRYSHGRYVTRFVRYNKYLALAGLAIRTHMATFDRRTEGVTTEDAIRAWEDMRVAALEWGQKPGSL